MIHQKLGVERTLLDTCHNLVTEYEEREAEEHHIKEALAICGYLDWSITKVKDHVKTSKEKTENRDKGNEKGFAVIPYIQGISKSF